MNWLGSGLFWGGVIVLWGVSVIVQAVFHVNIPVFRIVVGAILIALGVQLITGRPWGWHSRNSAAFTETAFTGEVKDGYNIAFGRGTVDLSGTPTGKAGVRTTVNVAFGHGRITVGEKQPVRVRASVAFGQACAPDGSSAAFGELRWESPAAKGKKEGVLEIRANVAFGGLDVVTK